MKFRNDDADFERKDTKRLLIKFQKERKKNVDDEKIVMRIEKYKKKRRKRENREI